MSSPAPTQDREDVAAPPPLTPADCDLQDFPFMPLMVLRLRKSKAWVKARRNPALGFFMVNLWTAAWHEVPAGSLEDDDDVLADAAMCDPGKWDEVRADVLRGWVKCSDDRLYHPVVCERVLEAWKAKTERAAKNAHESDRKRLEREERARHFEALKAAGIHRPWNTSLTDLRELIRSLSGGQVPYCPPHDLDLSRLREGEGQGEREGEGQGYMNYSAPIGAGGAPPEPPPGKAKAKTAAEEERSRLWAALKVALVGQKTCADHKAAGLLLGKQAAKYGTDVFIEAARQAVLHQPVDCLTYLVGLCETAAGKRQRLGGPMTDEQRQAANDEATEEALRILRGRQGGGSDVIDGVVREVEGQRQISEGA